MPIPVACRCGKSFAANDNLAGKTVKCPSCQQPLQIPAGNPSGATPPATNIPRTPDGKIVAACACGAKFAAAAELAGKQIKCPKCGQPLTVGVGVSATTPQAAPASGGEFSLADLLDEAGVKQKATGENACPSCGEFLAPEAVLCVACGYDRKKGKQIATEKVKKVEAKKLGGPTAAAKGGAAKQGGEQNPYASPGAAATVAVPAAQLTAMDYLFIILCGWIALIVAIVYIIQGNPKGKPLLIAWCIINAIAFGIGILLGVISIAMQASSGGLSQ